MHEWHTNESKNILGLINEFDGFEFDTDYSGVQQVKAVNVTKRVFSNHEDTISFVTSQSYGSTTAYLAAYTSKKLSKGYQDAFDNFLTKYKEYQAFNNGLTIAYGRTASKATCPSCKSSINLHYGKRFKCCPVCGSTKIISDSNWKILDTKKHMTEKAAQLLSRVAEKNEVTFVCGIEWHC